MTTARGPSTHTADEIQQAKREHKECEMHAGPLYHTWHAHLAKKGSS